jgi:ACT domain-containing protein
MALFQLKISLPDRPGSLGAIASAIGAAGCDIRSLSVMESKDGVGYDDILVAVPGTDPTDLVQVLSSIGGVAVISIDPVNS